MRNERRRLLVVRRGSFEPAAGIFPCTMVNDGLVSFLAMYIVELDGIGWTCK